MNLVILGGGSFGTSVANQLAMNFSNKITLLVRNKDLENEVNHSHKNENYFPGKNLPNNIYASTSYEVIKEADILFFAIPSGSILNIASNLKPFISKDLLIVNLSKGIFSNGVTIVEYLCKEFNSKNVITMKGPSFSAEMFDRNATLFTIGFENRLQLEKLKEATFGTNIYLDYTHDIRGVELLSALKNIYAIYVGNIDAKFNSANTRFLVLTKVFGEIREILKYLGGKEETVFLGCGFGDLCLTSLNDLSRNRTLGLLIGKGFYNNLFNENSVVLEGVKTLNFLNSIISAEISNKLPILNEINGLFLSSKYNNFNNNFHELFRKKTKTILTYGTFDLLHFGHLEILRRAKNIGDQLIVGLSTDEFNLVKGKTCQMPYNQRKSLLESISFVDLVIPEENWDQKVIDIKTHAVDCFVIGDDWKGKFDFLKEYCEVIYFERTKGISTTKLKKIIQEPD
jgi:glycerol-3-phosphate cytidylyltransferase